MKTPFRFEWDEANVDHIAHHQFIPEEVEDVFAEYFYLRRARDARRTRHLRRSRNGRYLVYGKTSGGRASVVVCVRKPGQIVRVITARDMNANERRRYRRIWDA